MYLKTSSMNGNIHWCQEEWWIPDDNLIHFCSRLRTQVFPICWLEHALLFFNMHANFAKLKLEGIEN